MPGQEGTQLEAYYGRARSWADCDLHCRTPRAGSGIRLLTPCDVALERGGSRRFWAQTPDVAAGAMAQSVMFASLQDQLLYEMRVRRQSARSYYSAPTPSITRPIPAKSVWMPTWL